MKMLISLATAAVLVAPISAQGNPADPDKKVAGGGTLPAGWSATLDNPGASLADARMVDMPPGFHVTTGPSGIYWREADAVKGGFHTVATFHQTKAPTHAEAYGLIVGGKDLKTANRSYLYFIIRGDGKFMVNSMKGSVRTVLVPWTEHAAVVKQDPVKGTSSNKLEIDGKIQAGKIAFRVNGTVVHEISAEGVDLDGIVGIRVNHNLDVHVQDFAVHKT